jgi:hypothetical protein
MESLKVRMVYQHPTVRDIICYPNNMNEKERASEFPTPSNSGDDCINTSYSTTTRTNIVFSTRLFIPSREYT